MIAALFVRVNENGYLIKGEKKKTPKRPCYDFD
jgi:hypothetical protein